MKKRMTRVLIIKSMIIVLLMTISKQVDATEYDCASGKHKYVAVEEKVATVSEDGYIIYECELCGDTYTRFTYVIEHQWSEWIIEKEATCTISGIKKRICLVGSTHSEMQVIPAVGHQYIETRKEPNCSRPGYITYTCIICDYSYIEEFGEAGDHHYEFEITKDPTCENVGEKTFTCDGCGDSYTEVIPAIGHNYGEWITDKFAGEGIEGLRYRECVNCGHRIMETIVALPVTPEEPFFGTTEIAVTIGNTSIWIFWAVLLAGDFRLLLWIRKEKKKVLKEKNEKRDDGYELI